MPRLSFIIFSALAVLAAPRSEAASSGLIVTFDNIPNRVRRDNPELAAARLRINEALGRMNQAGRLTNPELEGGLETNHRFKEGNMEVGIAQRFPVTDRLRLEKTISVIELRAAEAEVREVERQLVGKARDALVRVLAFRQQRQLREEQSQVSQSLADFIAESAKKGEHSPIDAGQARLDAARHASTIRQLRANEVAALGSLKPILGLRTTDLLNVTGSLPPANLPRGIADPDARPDLQAARLQAESARQNVELEKARRYEDVEAGIVAGIERSEDAPEGFENEGVIGLRVKVALPFWDKNEGNIQAAEARAERKAKETAALVHTIRHEADASQREMVEWINVLAEIADNLLPLAAKQAEEAEAAYHQGFADLQAVLRAREQQLELAASRIEALRNFHLARVRYEAAANR